MLSSQQNVQQHAKRIHVGRGSDGSASDLFRCGVFRGQCGSSVTSELCDCAFLSLALQEFCDAEIEQIHLAVVADEHVCRLDVAMHDQIGVCMRNRIKHIEK